MSIERLRVSDPAQGAPDADLTDRLSQIVREASAGGRPLEIVGGGTKRFYGRPPEGEILSMAGHCGIIDHEPSELVITARAGTPLARIEDQLAQHGQILGFEPPRLGAASTLGGVVAAGLSGPRRPFAGAVRDFVLGVRILDGRGRVMRLGGTVFKNVAGFDAFRLMAGAMGGLGVILDVSLRVSPAPAAEVTLALEEPWPQARARIAALARRPTPLSGAAHDGERLFLRLSGAAAAVAQTAGEIGGETTDAEIWDRLREMRGPLLDAPRLWRLSTPRAAPLEHLPGPALRDWAGAQTWLAGDASSAQVRRIAREAGGHAVLFRGATDGEAVFDTLPEPLIALHRRIKAAFDPMSVFNPGRMYEGL
jgi:glycolate oxidase FAD binding subunit